MASSVCLFTLFIRFSIACYSIINHMRDRFGLADNLHLNYELMNTAKFESLFGGLDKAQLSQIKYRYFSDNVLNFGSLCYCSFAHSEQMVANTPKATISLSTTLTSFLKQ